MAKNKYSDDVYNYDDEYCSRQKSVYKRDKKSITDQYRNKTIKEIINTTDDYDYYDNEDYDEI